MRESPVGRHIYLICHNGMAEPRRSIPGTVLRLPSIPIWLDRLSFLLDNEELFFNAARLDRSIAIKAQDYLKAANPRLESIAQRDAPLPESGA